MVSNCSFTDNVSHNPYAFVEKHCMENQESHYEEFAIPCESKWTSS